MATLPTCAYQPTIKSWGLIFKWELIIYAECAEMYVDAKIHTEQVEYCLKNVFSKKGANGVGLLDQFEPYALLIMLKSILAVILI